MSDADVMTLGPFVDFDIREHWEVRKVYVDWMAGMAEMSNRQRSRIWENDVNEAIGAECKEASAISAWHNYNYQQRHPEKVFFDRERYVDFIHSRTDDENLRKKLRIAPIIRPKRKRKTAGDLLVHH